MNLNQIIVEVVRASDAPLTAAEIVEKVHLKDRELGKRPRLDSTIRKCVMRMSYTSGELVNLNRDGASGAVRKGLAYYEVPERVETPDDYHVQRGRR